MRSLSIKIPNVSESLEEKLEALILGGAFWPDQPLSSERRLAEEFNVSRTSLRNALASLRSKGLLLLGGKRYYATNVMADLIEPGLYGIAKQDAVNLLDYWILFFAEAVSLAKKKAQNSDKVAILQAARHLKQCVDGSVALGVVAAFETLIRAVLDGCYNFFLSQTHYALQAAIRPWLEASLSQLCNQSDTTSAFMKTVDEIGGFSVDKQALFHCLSPAFVVSNQTDQPTGTLRDSGDPIQLIDVVLRHPISIEAVYELRLITEKHAAGQAAENADKSQRSALNAHLDQMTVIADNSPADYSKLDTTLHRLIADCTQNPVFSVIDAALAPVFSRTTNQWLNKHLEMRSDQTTIHLQHTQIVEAIAARDSGAATGSMQEHLTYVLRNLRWLREQDHLQEIATARRLLR
ncbi:hypothetical protein DL239_11980 [Sedimentitalea sp. CY04]|uniref:HTH gntR-type domain-containing protein n=1 Tax=Parasedimentitalea denitrificans TaxID=2211118 RepID=A0ABX0W7P4_9RHOB|nr:FCD domain-containing protein [Sedimentitalea sp. CY04]NIZ61691.1 hypothetical protein [Sedimentitalea sp. CY04]